MKNNEVVKNFLGRNLDALSNPEFGSHNFNEVKSIFGELRELIIEMIEIGSNVKLPSGIEGIVLQYVEQWNANHSNIRDYKFVEDAQNRFGLRQNIINSVINWHNSCLLGYDSQQNNRPNNFLVIYTTIKSLADEGIENERDKLKKLISDFEGKKKDVDEITNELRKKSGEQTITDYATIFKAAADRHSSFIILPELRIGAAELWLMLGLILIVTFASTITVLNDWLGINYSTNQPGLLTIQIITRLLIISIWVYVISFCLKQFSINKHLATLNRHRQNTLDSYKLFIQSLDPSDGATKNALMMEVAKSIYEHGNTGHLSGKGSENSPSIIELTRFINQTGK